jgi:hypothetical protein
LAAEKPRKITLITVAANYRAPTEKKFNDVRRAEKPLCDREKAPDHPS